MPESTCLHIQDRESGPIRVVELPWISVRIGRAAYCEVRLCDEDLAEETCRLNRRGRLWSLMPSGGQSSVVLEGRTIKGPCPLPFDVPFQIGRYCLTLRHDIAAEPDWELYPASATVRVASAAPLSPGEIVSRSVDDRAHLGASPAPDSESARGPARPDRDRNRWEARWKAAEAQLKSRTSGLRAAREGFGASSPTPFDAVPSQERPTASPRSPGASTPLIEPMSRPIPTPRVPRIEPGWSPLPPQQTSHDAPMSGRSRPDIDRVVRPVPEATVPRLEPMRTGLPEPSSAWRDWIARERPADPSVLRKPSEPVDPDEIPPDTRPAVGLSNTTGLETASSVHSREVSIFEDPEFTIPNFPSPIEELGESGSASTEETAQIQGTSTEQVDESSVTITEDFSGGGSQEGESDRGTEGADSAPVSSRFVNDREPGRASQLEEKPWTGVSEESLAKPGRTDGVLEHRAPTLGMERGEDSCRPPVAIPGIVGRTGLERDRIVEARGFEESGRETWPPAPNPAAPARLRWPMRSLGPRSRTS